MMSQRPPGVSRRTVVFIALFLLLIALLGSTRFYTDVLWFQEVGFASVLWKSLRTQFLVGLSVGLVTAAIVWVNLWLAARLAPPYRITLPDAGRTDPLDAYRSNLGPYIGWIRLAIAGVIGFLGGIAASAEWQTVLLWANRVSFGESDPQFGRDIGFYVFELPFLDTASNWLWFALIASLLLVLAAHYFYGAIRPEFGLRGVLPGALAHVSVLLGLLALTRAFRYWLGTFQLNFSTRGTVTGASYTDVNAQLPALQLLAIVSIISAVLFLVTIRVRRLSLPLTAVAIWLLVGFLAGTVWPLAVQRFSVDPQEQQREDPYIARNIEATRAAFALDDVQAEPYPATAVLSGEQFEENEDVFQNVRLWDPALMERAYSSLQAVRPYYQFTDVDIDRYVIDDRTRQVMLSIRELSLDDLPEGSVTWQNLHLQFTHGFGLVASLANEATVTGQPSFIARNVPPVAVEGAEALEAAQPRIYYGEGFQAHEYAVVDTEQDELDFALEDGTVQRSNYDGAGGIGVGGFLRRVAFAIREGDPNLVLSGLITSDSQILIYRNVRDRVRRAAPFLSLDNDPYPAVIDGRIVWIVDAYTTTEHYPYSERFPADQALARQEAASLQGQINYIRNSVKVVVDAYDGDMKLYVVNEEDPLIQAWRKAFPDLFTTEEPSADLRAHFRYPEDLFRVQTEVFRTYHMTNAADFYSREDEWEIPLAPSFDAGGQGSERIPPVYLLFRPPGVGEQEFVLTRPYVPRNRPNMISTLIARSDPDSYGEILSLQFSRSRLVTGPQQIENLINQDVDISRTRTLLGQQGSSVQFGNLIILPVENSIIYVQPMYVIAQNVGIPELKRVVVASGNQIVMRENFGAALAEVFDLEGAGEPPPDLDDLDIDIGDEPTPVPTAPPGDLADLIAEANRIYGDAQEALAAGDFAEYGRLIEELGRVIREAQQAAADGG